MAAGLAVTALLADAASGQILQPKRGFAGGTSYSDIQATGASWYYNWGSTPSNIGNYNANFYPMFWSGPSQTTVNSVLATNPQYVLGFNEPENSTQSNMSVATALGYWSNISSATIAYNSAHSTNIQLISPAVGDDSSGQPWIESFMSQAKSQGLKVDAVAFHWYDDDTTNGAQAASDFESRVQWYHNEFGLPVFITEFADHDWGGTYSLASMIAANTQMLSIVIPWLNSQSYVTGYSSYQWFANGETALYSGTPPLPTTLGYPYDGSVGTGSTADISGTNLGEHVAFLTGGTLTMTTSAGTIQYINALTGTSTITGSINWGLNSASTSNWVEIEPGAALVKSGTNTITFQNGTMSNNGVMQVSQGVLQCSVPMSGTGTLNITGTGTAILSAANTYTGGTNIYSGTLQVASDAVLGGSGASISVYPAGVLAGGFAIDQALLSQIANPSTYGVVALAANDSNNLNFASANLSNASLGATSGSFTYSGNLTPNGTTYRLGGGGGTLVVSSALSGAADTLQINPNTASSSTVSLTNTGNTLGGAVTINAGTLKLDYTGTNTGATILNNNALKMGGGTLSILGTNTSGQNTSQSFASLSLTGGRNSIVDTAGGSGSSNLSLGAITRSAGATVDFTLPASGSITTTTTNSATTILGGWATVGGSTWASVGTGGVISGISSYTAASSTTANYAGKDIDITSSQTSGGVINPNSLRFNTGAATTLTLTGTNSNISSGGILVTSAVGNNLSTITGGSITAANAQHDLIVTNNDTSSQLTIASIIANYNSGSATTATSLTKAGPGTVVVTGAYSYSGTTYVDGGTLDLHATQLNNSAVVNNGGTLIIGALSNSQYFSLTVNSGGTIVDNGNTFSNTLNFNGGTMTGTGFWNDQSQNATAWTIGAGTNSTLSIASLYSNTNGTNISSGAGSVFTLASTVSGVGLNIYGSGTVILSGANTFTGAFNIGGSTIVQVASAQAAASGALGNTSAGTAINLLGGTLQYSPANNYDYSSRFSTSTVQKYNIDTNGQSVTFATGLSSAGGTLTKLGAGTLTLNAVSALTGATSINAGTLALGSGGTLSNTSGVSIAAGATFDISQATTPFALSSSSATLSGSGTVNGNYNHTIGILSPGSAGTVGTLTFNNNLTLAGGTLSLNLSPTDSTPGGTVNDLISVGGNLNLSSPTILATNFSGGTPAVGTTYDLINFTGSLIGATSNLIAPGPTLQVVQNGQHIDLIVTRAAAAALNWNSSSSSNWDVTTSQNWFNTGTSQSDVFVQNDNVSFTDGIGLQTSINLVTNVSPGSVTVSSNTNNYVFGGSGSIGGNGGLTMTGSSTLTMNASNSYSGTTNAAGGVIVVNAGSGLGIGALTVGPLGTVQVTSSGTLGNSSVTVNGTAAVVNTAAAGLGTGALTIGSTGNVIVGNGGTAGSLNNSSYTVNGSLTYNLSSGLTFANSFNGTGTINLTGGGSYAMNGTASNFNGSINVLAGHLAPGNVANAFGNATVNASGGYIYDVSGLNLTNSLILSNSPYALRTGGGRNNPISGSITIAGNTGIAMDGGSSLTLTGPVSGNNFNVAVLSGGSYVYIDGGWNLGTGTLTSPTPLNLDPSTSQTIWSKISSTSSIAQQLGTTTLVGSNSFGSVYVQVGVLQVSTIADSGPSNLGGSGAALHLQGGTLEITGGSSTTARSVIVGGGSATNPTIQVDPGASLALAGNVTYTGSGIGSLTLTGGGTLTLSGNDSYTGGTNVNAGTLVLASGTAFPSGTSNAGTALTVGTGATVQIANHGAGSTFEPFVSSVSNSGTIDVTNNALVLRGANASIGTISNEIAAAYSSGAWNGTSGSMGVITSSTAAADKSHLTGVGFATGLTSFEGGAVSTADVLIKDTYYGDANLDGHVDGSDYSRIDNGVLSHLSGWYNGDFNYDGTINGSDYTLIDNAFNQQGAQLTSQFAGITASIASEIAVNPTNAAVPEPSSLALLGIGALTLSRRRQRRRPA